MNALMSLFNKLSIKSRRQVAPKMHVQQKQPVNLQNELLERRSVLQKQFFEKYGHKVQWGPFKGMNLPEVTFWGDGDKLPKALGQYEAELHDIILKSIAKKYDTIVNVGCAEGFYAIGLALLNEKATVYAFDTEIEAQKLCKTAASINRVDERVQIGGTCDTDILQKTLETGDKPFFLCDCEGYETVLINPELVPALNKTTILVECHDFLDEEITPLLKNRLSSTHIIHEISEGERNPNLHEFQSKLSSIDRWITVCEFRPEKMGWLYCEPVVK